MTRAAILMIVTIAFVGVAPGHASCAQVDLGISFHRTVTSQYSCDFVSTASIFCGDADGMPGNAWLELYHDITSDYGQVAYTHEYSSGGYYSTSLTALVSARQCAVAQVHGYISDLEEPNLVWLDESRTSGIDCCEPYPRYAGALPRRPVSTARSQACRRPAQAVSRPAEAADAP